MTKTHFTFANDHEVRVIPTKINTQVILKPFYSEFWKYMFLEYLNLVFHTPQTQYIISEVQASS